MQVNGERWILENLFSWFVGGLLRARAVSTASSGGDCESGGRRGVLGEWFGPTARSSVGLLVDVATFCIAQSQPQHHGGCLSSCG